MSARILLTPLLLVASGFGQETAKAPPSEAEHYPSLTRADVPLYPPLARTAHVSGTVEIKVTVDRGALVDAQVKSSSSPLLSTSALANVKTWQFQPEDRATFLVNYVYRIEGEQTSLPENPKVELDLPHLVTVTAKPFKPSCSDCVTQKRVSGSGSDSMTQGGLLHESAHAEGTLATLDSKDCTLHIAIPVLTKPGQ